MLWSQELGWIWKWEVMVSELFILVKLCKRSFGAKWCLSSKYYMASRFWYVLLLFNRSAMSNSLWSCGLQHIRLPCPSLSPRVLKLMSIGSMTPSNLLILPHSLLLLPSIFPSIRVSWLFASGGQSIGASASILVLPVNIQGWFPLNSDIVFSKDLLKHLWTLNVECRQPGAKI